MKNYQVDDETKKKAKAEMGCLSLIFIIPILICLPAYIDVYGREIKTFLGNTFALLGFISFILLVVSFFKPKATLFWVKNKTTATKAMAIVPYITLFLLFEILALTVTPQKEQYKKESNHEKIDNNKLSTPYYDSIFVHKAYPAIDLKREPRIEFDSSLKKIEIKIRLNHNINEEELKSIGVYYHDKYFAPPYNRIYMYYYTPRYVKEDAGCYATTHFVKDSLEVSILDY